MSNTVQKKLKRGFKYASAILLVFLMITAALYYFQESIIFRPTVLQADYDFKFDTKFEEVFLEPENNVKINAVHFKTELPKGVILYFHGNMGDLSRWGNIAEKLVEHNYDVFIIDYRTYGKSTGQLSEEALYRDAQYCYNYLKSKYSQENIILYGRSLGTGIASYVAANNDPKRLILETPYYSLTDVAKHRFPIVPVKYLLKYKIPTYQYLLNTECPVDIIHGTEDGVIPISSAKKLIARSKPNVSMKVIEGGTHNNLATFEAYTTWIEKLL